MQALILAGGKGTRLRPLTVYTPKPIVPLINRPFLLFQIEILRNAGITDITLSLGYQPNKIEDVMGDGSDYGVNLRMLTEPTPMGTGGAYKFAEDAIRETTVVLNGDILTDIDIGSMLKTHNERKAEITIALTPVEDPTAYGLVETDENDRVLRFREKPKKEELADLPTANINAGIYIIEPTILDIIQPNENVSFEYNVFPDILAAERPFYAHILSNEYWRDLGTPTSYLDAHLDYLSGKIKRFDLGAPAKGEVATSATVDPQSVIGEGAVLKPHVRVVNSVIGPGVQIEERAVIENSVIWPHARIASAAEIKGAVIGRSCYVGRNVSIGHGTVLGDKTSLTDYTKV